MLSQLVPSTVYAVLSQWYSGGPELTRAVIELPNSVKQVELFPLILRVARVDSSSGGAILSGEEVTLSELSTVDALLQATCKALLLSKFVDKTRLWFFDENHPDHKYRLRSSRPKDLSRLNQSSVFLVEIQDEDGSWPLSLSVDSDGQALEDDDDGDSIDSIRTSPRRLGDVNQPPQLIRRTSDICSRGNLESLTALASSKNSSTSKDGAVKPSTVVEDEGLATARTLKRRFSRNAFTGTGLVGLDNLGNTCYMSSALQCMSHTRLLVDFFKNEEYLHDINLHNRDGANGKLAVAFGELLRVLWTSEKKRFAPNEFKRVLSRFNPQFSGSDQHDAQELLACLLSGLSEDLNRVVKKPYIEQPDSDGRCDTVVANEWWQNHAKREFSVIVALFTGQYKSLLECSVCHYESARFEPFTFLQLSLPESSYRSIVATVIFNNGRVPMKYSVRVRNDGCVRDVEDEVIDLIRRMDKRDGVPPRSDIHVIIARISALHTVDAILEPKTPLIRIHERDQLTAYELDDLPQANAFKMALTSFAYEQKSPMTKLLEASSLTEESEQSESVVTDADSPTATSRASSPASSDPQAIEAEEENDAQPVEEVQEIDHAPFKIGSSVYVRADKTRDFLAARVIGGSTKNGPTVDVAYPSGVRRYHIPLSKVLERRREEAFVFLVHRRVERSMNSFAEAHITRLFGAPLSLRVSLRTTSNFDLYMLVWNRLHRIFNWQTPPTAETMDSLLREKLTREDEDQQRRLRRTSLSTVALGRHLAWTNFGFSLRMVTSHGIGCSRCEWMEGCLGCLILPAPSMQIELSAEETIAIDWDIRTLKEEYDPIQASKMDTHESVQVNHRLDNMPLNIHRCLEIFTAKENISEAYCGRCKTHRPATKTMDLWRLPPVLVIQLKRFCFTQTSRRKLHHLVDFPLTGLRLEDFVAKKRDPRRFHESGLAYWRFLGGKLKDCQGDSDEAQSQVSQSEGAAGIVSSPIGTLMDAPATAALRADDTFLYDLYGVVNHVGALGAGHYFAYVLSEDDNKWKCFNDHQCKEIDAKEVVSSSAYILFYRRRDMKDVPIETLFPPIRRKTKANADDGDTSADEDQAKVEELIEQTKAATHGSNCIIS
jgi:ubiquitin carboxyl-terminal hydrolase 6/32